MSLERCSEICQQHARLMCCWVFAASQTSRGEKKRARPISFMTASYHSLSSRFAADCLVLAWWIIWMESLSLVRRSRKWHFGLLRRKIRVKFDHDLILHLVSWCSAFCLVKLICNNLPVNKQINWIASFFLPQPNSVSLLQVSQHDCMFVYLFIWWTSGRSCCLTTGTVSLLCSDEMCEMRDAMQSDPYMLCTWGCKSNPISNILLEYALHRGSDILEPTTADGREKLSIAL